MYRKRSAIIQYLFIGWVIIIIDNTEISLMQSVYLIKARDRCLIFLYLEWVFGKSNCEEFQIAFPYRNGLTKFFKGLQQIATMNIIANIMGILYTLKRILRW